MARCVAERVLWLQIEERRDRHGVARGGDDGGGEVEGWRRGDYRAEVEKVLEEGGFRGYTSILSEPLAERQRRLGGGGEGGRRKGETKRHWIRGEGTYVDDSSRDKGESSHELIAILWADVMGM